MALAARRNDLAAASRRNAEVLVAMGMAGRLNAALERGQREISRRQPARQRRRRRARRGRQGAAHDAAIGGARVGAYLVIHQEATAGIIIAGSILSARALAPVDLAIAHWKGFVAARQSWQRLNRLLEQMPAQPEPTQLQAPVEPAVGRGRQRSCRRAIRASSCRT